MGLIAPDVRRWLKFEEDVEDGGERWSKPYVATLSLHSLSELRSCIINGTVLLDICANSIEEIAGTAGAASLRERPSSVCRGALRSGIKPCPNGASFSRNPAVFLSWFWMQAGRATVTPAFSGVFFPAFFFKCVESDRKARRGKKIALFRMGNNYLSRVMNKHFARVF